MAHPVPLTRNRSFVIFWAAQALSTVGSAMSLIALPLLVLDATGSVAQMGLLTGLGGAVTVATGLFAGVVVDRTDRRLMMIVCDAARVVVYGVVPLCWLIFGSQVWLLYVVVACAAVFQTLFDVAYSAAVPSLVPTEQITAANSRLQATFAVGFVIGPSLAGLIAAVSSPVTVVAVDAVTFALSLVGLTLVRLRPASEVPDPENKPTGAGLWHDFITGVRFIWGQRVLRSLTLLLMPMSFLALGLVDVFIYYLRHDLGQDDTAVGFLMGVAAVGAVVGALCAPLLRTWLGFGRSWLAAYLVAGLGVAYAGVSPQLTGALIAAALFAFGSTVAGVCGASLCQTLTPAHLLGRVMSSFWVMHTAFGPIGAAALTTTVERVGVPRPLMGVGVLVIVVAAVGAFTPLRHPVAVTAPPADRDLASSVETR